VITSGDGANRNEVIRADLEATRDSYHELLDSLSDKDWQRRSGNQAWTIGQVMYHMTVAPRMLPADVRMIRKGGRAPKFLAALFDWLNIILTRWGARKHTRQTIGDAYDVAHAAALEALDTIREDEWDNGVEYPDWDPLLSGFVTIERLLRYLILHFEVHAKQVRQGLEEELSR
jgi:hypothetical protein